MTCPSFVLRSLTESITSHLGRPYRQNQRCQETETYCDALLTRTAERGLWTNRKIEQAKQVGAIRHVHVTDEQLVQARPEYKHDRSDEKHVCRWKR
jgi:stalled ribosome rescue protein Dom34